MRTTQWARAAEIFADVSELPFAERVDRLNVLCGGDEELRASAQRLLAVQGDTESDTALASGVQSALLAWTKSIELPASSQVGPYRIVRMLGTGGMGQIYLAERSIDGGVQCVALKVPQQRPGQQFAERFRRERSILAGLSHPAIARLLDFGVFEDGRPYFAMEYVDGLSIIEWCDRHGLGFAERLRLFMSVLAAVQHAHENLILHRDLKAANVLVGNDGLPRLLDFGIAKSIEGPGDAALTMDGAQFFSLGSAAPEQINGRATSAATDIYALGALLYELISGVPALQLVGLSPSEAIKAINDETPVSPLVAIQALAERDAARVREIAAHRSLASLAALKRQMRGDFELILARTLRKESRLRYASVEALARDIQALLDMRPIAQRHGDRLYRLERFARRHRAIVLSAAILLIFSVAYLWLSWRQAEALAQARDRAEVGRAQAEQVTAFLIDLFRNADPTVARGSNPDAKQMLERGAAGMQSGLVDQPELRARLLNTMADIYLSLNDFANARRYAEQSLALVNTGAMQDPGIHRASLELLARIALAQARYPDAIALIDAALQGRTLSYTSTDLELHLFGLRAVALQGNAERTPALAAFAAVATEMRRRYGQADARTRAVQRRWALALGSAGEIERSRALQRQAAHGGFSVSYSIDPESGKLAAAQAKLMRDEGRTEDAVTLAQEALRIVTAIYGEQHSETAAMFNLLGTIAQQQQKYERAAEYFQRALEIMQQLYPPNHPRRAAAEFNLGLLHLHYRDDAAAALPHMQAAVAQASASLVAEHPNLAIFRLGLGEALRDQGEYRSARIQLAAAQETFRKAAAPRGRNRASATGEIACIDNIEGRDRQRAQAELAEALALLSSEMPTGHPRIKRLSHCLSAWK